MRGPSVRAIVVAAGGTGGHFFPAEALAGELLLRGHRVALMTDARSGGLASPVFASCERFVLRGAGLAGRGRIQAATAAMSLAVGTLEARAAFMNLNPAALIGFGGYPSVAPVLATRFMRRRPLVMLHEQNAVLGRANRTLSRFADAIALSFETTERVPARVATEITGNPVRPSIVAAPYPAIGEIINLVVLGGSLGARVFSDVVPAALGALPIALRARLSVTQQCRSEDLERVRAAYADIGVTATLASFFQNVPTLLADAHLIIARAGASTIAELATVGRPAILVPLPGAIDDHQTANARALADAGGAWLIPQPEFSAAALAGRLTELLTKTGTLPEAAARTATRGRADAAARLADLVEAAMVKSNVGEHAA